ncbi:hypothetical protein PAMP_017454 [Pampus punctatissimus]
MERGGPLASCSTFGQTEHSAQSTAALESLEEAERTQRANQHHHHHLLRAGVQGLSLNVSMNKAQRLNNNMAVQHCHQTTINKYWKLWQDRLEEAEDKSFQPLTEMAVTNYSTSLLSSCFCHWREKLAEQRHMQVLKHRADVWFAERVLPCYFNSWVKFTLQKRLHKQRRHKAEVYNQQRQYSWVFYIWRGQSEKHKEEMLSEKMAILHEERGHMQRAWARWMQRTEQKINEEEKQKASDHLYLHRLLHKTLTQWKDNSTEIRDRRNREQRACHQGDLCCMRWAVERWKKFVHSQRKKKSSLEQMQRYHEIKLLKHTFVAWKEASVCVEGEHSAADRSVACLERRNNTCGVKAPPAEGSTQQGPECCCCGLFNNGGSKPEPLEVMKRQGILLLRLKMCQVYFEQWKMKMQHRRRESKQTEQALWHWSLTLQAKVLYGWRLWVTEQRRKQEQAARAAHVYRDQLLREGVTCILTYAAHMSDLTTSLTQHSREQRLRHIQRVVKRCAMRWKERALCKPGRGQEVRRQPQKKSVTFCLSVPGVSPSDSVEQDAGDGALSELLPTRMLRRQPLRYEELFGSPLKETPRDGTQKQSAVTNAETAPQTSEVSPSQKRPPAELSCLHPALVPFTSARQSAIIPDVSPSKPDMTALTSPPGTQSQDLLLPPSAFMTTGTQNMLGKTCSSGPGDVPFAFGPPFKHLSSIYTASSEEEDAVNDPNSSLTGELLNIQLDMKSFQQDKKQLSWRSASRDCPPTWKNGNQQCCSTQKGSNIYRLSTLHEFFLSVVNQKTWKRITLCLQHDRKQRRSSHIP